MLILDLKDLDAQAEYQLRRDLRKKTIRLKVLKNSLARRVFSDLGMDGLSRFLEGVLGGGVGRRGDRRAGQGALEAGQDALQETRDQGGSAVDGVVVGPEQGSRTSPSSPAARS